LDLQRFGGVPLIIRRAKALRCLSAGDLLDLIDGCSLSSFAPGEVVVSEGGPPAEAFLLLSGRVSVRRVDSTGRDQVLALRGPGEWIGEMGIVRGAAHSATVVAEIPTRGLAVPRDAFVRAVLASRGAAGDLLKIVASRLLESDQARLCRREPAAAGDPVWNVRPAAAPDGRVAVGEHPSFHEATRTFQARLVRRSLEEVDGNASEAARRLGIARSYLYKLLGSPGVSRRGRVELGERAPLPSFGSRPQE
jgi:CRP-like cAMP-binding protein